MAVKKYQQTRQLMEDTTLPSQPIRLLADTNMEYAKPSNQPRQGTLYLLHPCEFRLMNYPIYKIGRTSNLKKRKSQYGGITEIISFADVGQNLKLGSRCG